MTAVAADEEPVVRYHEAARPYRSMWYTLAVLLAGFGIDLAVGVHGAIEHIPGWVLFGGVLLAIQALILYAARATHSLTLTDSEVRVGEERVQRVDLASIADTALASDVPVLGWPGGRPRGVKSVVVRLVDDREVEIPTRFPARLRAALALDETAPPERDVPRPAEQHELELLADIDDRAEAIFRVAGHQLPDIAFDEDGLDDAAAVFVIGDPPYGFAQLDEVDGEAHLAELAVIPSAMRRGHGSELVSAAIAWAGGQGYRRLTLVTYADIAWNGPFYRRLGFVEMPAEELSGELLRRRTRQTELGLDEVGRRIVMRREL